MAHCVSGSTDTSLYDNYGNYDVDKHGPVIHHLDRIEEQKNDERDFAAVTQSWLRNLLFGEQKAQVDQNYVDLSTFHYPLNKEYLDFMALKYGSIHSHASLAFKEILLLILLVLDYVRTGSNKSDYFLHRILENFETYQNRLKVETGTCLWIYSSPNHLIQSTGALLHLR